MDAGVLKAVGQIAGIGGVALGIFFLLYRDIIRKSIFPKLPPRDAYRLLRLIAIAIWSIAVIGVAAWFFSGRLSPTTASNGSISIDGDVSGGSNVTNVNK